MKLYEKVFFFISGHGRGWVFSSSDLMKKFTRQEADSTLSVLAKNGKIRRIARGLYDYPKFSSLLEKDLNPDIDRIANAYARKFNWRIEMSGDTALNILELSTQVPGRYVYLSNGPSREYQILNGISLTFKKSSLKNIGFKHKDSRLIVRALKALGKDVVDKDVIKHIKKRIDPSNCAKILDDTNLTTSWIYEAIKNICKVDKL
ncbi:MAG: hypothetical protein HN434_05220 [Candidatus Thioglobus sp.]|nr:hypothetical protein [Candidatus Thioglobus sp.]